MEHAKGAVGIPSGSGIKDAAVDFGLGMGGALVVALSQSFLGSGFIGAIGGALLAGSMIKGVRGEILATMLGFTALAGMTAASSNSSSGQSSRPVV
jgi:hypothetical protein